MEGMDVTILPAFIKMIFGDRPFRAFRKSDIRLQNFSKLV